MGILNITPDSFSDGGRFLGPDAALDHALAMLDAGADILDLGGESTRPNSIAIEPAEEQARALPVLRAILRERPNAVLSIDTYHAETARLAIESGAEIVNDVSGHLWDAAMSSTCAALGCGSILMHTRGRPHEWRALHPLTPSEVVPLVTRELATRAASAMAAGVSQDQIVLDPGFGFGKILNENFPLLAGLETLHLLGFPILVGVSRKGFLRRAVADTAHEQPTTIPTPDSHLPTSAANTAAILAGAHILRVHDVEPAREVAAIADRILAAAESIPTTRP
jgi:dihydropteroate synthase